MNIRFNIHYKTLPGHNICVCGSSGFLGACDTNQGIDMNYSFDGQWSATVEIPQKVKNFKYKYILKDNDANVIWEWGIARKVDLQNIETSLLILQESWRSPSNEEKIMFSSAFSNVRHKWRYRMRQSIDDLKNAKGFNQLIQKLIKESGRDSDY